MNSKRVFFILTGLIVLLFVGLIGATLGVNSMLSKQGSDLVTTKAINAALGQEQVSLVKAKKDVAKYSDLQKIVNSVVPEDKDQAEAVRELVKIADAYNVTLSSINFPASTLGSGPNGTAATSTTTTSSSSGAGSKTSALSQLTPVKNIPGVYLLEITVKGDATHPVRYDKFVSFLKALENNRRTAQVSSISITPDIQDRNNLNFSLILNTYIKP
jgi:hypothetical protein